MNRFFSSYFVGLILILGVIVTHTSPAAAQNVDGNIGLGGQVGQPAGISLKVYNPERMSFDFLAAYDLDNFFFLNVHGLFERPISDNEALNLIYGPGVFIGTYNRPRGADDDVALGVSGRIGLNYYIKQFELFIQITPRLEITPTTTADLGGGLGFRYYF